jgi:hypothetical protein
MKVSRPDPWEKWMECLDGLPWGEGKTKQRQTYKAFIRAGTLRIDENRAMAEVERRVREAGGKVVPRDLRRNLLRAYGYAETAEARTPITAGSRPEFCPAALEALAAAGPEMSLEDLAVKSPVDPAQLNSGDFLEAVFKPGECVIVCKSLEDPGRVYRVGSRDPWINGLGSPEGVFYLSNPADGLLRKNADGRNSLRSEGNLTDFRHLVLESDEAEALVWLRAMAQVSLPIVAIYASGGTSVHILTRFECRTKAAFLEVLEPLKPGLVRYGADPAAMTAVRLTRLPGAMRGKNEQKLLFLDPAAAAVRLSVRSRRGEA